MSNEEEVEFRQRLASLVRALTQGQGISTEAVGRENGTGLFDDMAEQDVFRLIHWAANQLTDNPYANAIRNALGLGEFSGATLTERREQFLRSRGISLRTLIRHEQSGAEMIADQIAVASQGEKITKGGSQIIQLRESIHDIQTVLAWMIDPGSVEKVMDSVEAAKRRVVETGSWAAHVAALNSADEYSPSREEWEETYNDKQAYQEWLEEKGISASSESQSDQD